MFLNDEAMRFTLAFGICRNSSPPPPPVLPHPREDGPLPAPGEGQRVGQDKGGGGYIAGKLHDADER